MVECHGGRSTEKGSGFMFGVVELPCTGLPKGGWEGPPTLSRSSPSCVLMEFSTAAWLTLEEVAEVGP